MLFGHQKGKYKSTKFSKAKAIPFSKFHQLERKENSHVLFYCFVRDDASKTKMNSKSLYWNGLWRTWIYFLNPKFNESNRPSVFSIPYNLHFTPDKFLRAKLLRCKNIILESKWFEKRKKNTIYSCVNILNTITKNRQMKWTGTFILLKFWPKKNL